MEKHTGHSLISSRSTTFYMMLRELRLINKIPSLFIMVFIYPLLILLIFFVIYQEGSITQLPIAVIDQDQSVTSRQLVQRIAANPEISINASHHDLIDAKKDLSSANIYAIVLIPPNFEKHMLANNQPEVTTFYNNQYMTSGGIANRAIAKSLSGYISDLQLQKLKSNAIPTAIGQNQLKPIDIDLHPVFNPTLSFVFTLVSGAFPAVMQIIMMFAITVSIHQELKYQPNLNSLRRLANHNPLRFFIHKTALYLLIFIIPLLIMDGIMIYYFGLPIRGSLWLLFLGDLLFIISSLAIGMMFALFIANKLANFSFVGIFSSPAFGFTGLLFPRIAMNSFAYIWGGILPITWYIQLRLDQTLRGLTDLQALTPLFFMLLLTVIPLALMTIRLKQYSKRGKA